MIVAREHKLRIERVLRQPDYRTVVCEFWWHHPSAKIWLVSVAHRGSEFRINTVDSKPGMDVETASALSVALGMAIDWIAEQKT